MTMDESQKWRNSLVLLVDDTPENLQVLGTLLEGMCRTAVAINGRDALHFIKKRPPDLILLDIMMPEMDGFEVCTRLKSDPQTRDIPVIFLSAMSEAEDKTRGFEVGSVDYITKPFDPVSLGKTIKKKLEKCLEQQKK